MIGFVGLSHLGLVTSISIASKGFDVVCYDPNAELVGELKKARLPYHEPSLDDLLATHAKRIEFVSDSAALKGCDVVYISLDVKTNDANESDLAPLHTLVTAVSAYLSSAATLVVLSQVPPGFSRKLSAGLKNKLYYQVETLIFGRAVERALYPERYIVGCADPTVAMPAPFAGLLGAFDCPVLPMRYESAELAKISINMCLVSSISVANTLAEICEKTGAEWTEIAPALKLDKRIGPHSYLAPGLGIAGGNLERDLVTICSLAREHGTDAGVVEAWIANSKYRLDWALRMLHDEVLAKIPEPVVAVWGLAYKQDTKSTKNSPSLHLIKALDGVEVRAYDPVVELDKSQRGPRLMQTASPEEACTGASVLMVMTPWKQFTTVELRGLQAVMPGRTIIDPYAVLNREECVKLGFKYLRLGSAKC